MGQIKVQKLIKNGYMVSAWWDTETPVHNIWTAFILSQFIHMRPAFARGTKGKVKIMARKE